MTFAHTVEEIRNIAGDRRIATGTFAQVADDGGGVISLDHFEFVDFIGVQSVGTAVRTAAPAINDTFPISSRSTTIITAGAETSGIFIIYGS